MIMKNEVNPFVCTRKCPIIDALNEKIKELENELNKFVSGVGNVLYNGEVYLVRRFNEVSGNDIAEEFKQLKSQLKDQRKKIKDRIEELDKWLKQKKELILREDTKLGTEYYGYLDGMIYVLAREKKELEALLQAKVHNFTVKDD